MKYVILFTKYESSGDEICVTTYKEFLEVVLSYLLLGEDLLTSHNPLFPQLSTAENFLSYPGMQDF